MTGSVVAARTEEMRARAERIADEVLFPAAQAVDRADRVPASHLDLLAEQGFYGVAAPVDEGGLGIDDFATAGHLVSTFAGGCLATAFVWIQHHGPVLAAAFSSQPGVREKWLAPLAGGQRRGGIARAGARPGASGLRVRQTPQGWQLNGQVPWVTGWDLIDVVHVAALDDEGMVRFLLVDAVESATLQAQVHDLSAARASRTATLTFTGHDVPADRFTGAEPYDAWAASEASGSSLNGFLALGVAGRCLRLLGDAPLVPGLAAELAACRAALLAADALATPPARAAASELAMRCATALAVQTGSRSVLPDSPASRLIREAGFLLVFGTRPAIRDSLLALFAR